MGGSIPAGFWGAQGQTKGPPAAVGSPGGDEPGGLSPRLMQKSRLLQLQPPSTVTHITPCSRLQPPSLSAAHLGE